MINKIFNIGARLLPKKIKQKIVPKKLKEIRKMQVLSEFYSQFISKGSLCFDVGANRGDMAEVFLEMGGIVVSVEPEESCQKILAERFNKNHNFNLVPKGLADKEGELTFSVCEDSTNVSTFSEKWKTGTFSERDWNIQKKVKVTTLDKLIEEFGLPDFCKIDVEGFEYQVLTGLTTPIPTLSFEFIKDFLDEAEKCIDRLGEIGYEKFNFCIGQGRKFEFETWVDADQIVKKLYSLKDKEFAGGDILWGDIYAKS